MKLQLVSWEECDSQMNLAPHSTVVANPSVTNHEVASKQSKAITLWPVKRMITRFIESKMELYLSLRNHKIVSRLMIQLARLIMKYLIQEQILSWIKIIKCTWRWEPTMSKSQRDQALVSQTALLQEIMKTQSLWSTLRHKMIKLVMGIM
jgi:hypothetical protein